MVQYDSKQLHGRNAFIFCFTGIASIQHCTEKKIQTRYTQAFWLKVSGRNAEFVLFNKSHSQANKQIKTFVAFK